MIDLDYYRINLPWIKSFLDAKPGWKYQEVVGWIAMGRDIPIIAVSYFIGELYGFTDEINAKIESDKRFYSVARVKGSNRLEDVAQQFMEENAELMNDLAELEQKEKEV